MGSNPIWGSDFFRVLQTFHLSCVCCFIFQIFKSSLNLNLIRHWSENWCPGSLEHALSSSEIHLAAAKSLEIIDHVTKCCKRPTVHVLYLHVLLITCRDDRVAQAFKVHLMLKFSSDSIFKCNTINFCKTIFDLDTNYAFF